MNSNEHEFARPNILFILADDLGWCDLGAVAQFSRLTGVIAPVAVGTSRLMTSRDDTRPADTREDGGTVRFVLDTLRRSAEPVAGRSD